MEAFLLSNGPWGLVVLGLLYAVKRLYDDSQKARNNERQALLRLLQHHPESLEDDK